jgi:hypothetical protein
MGLTDLVCPSGLPNTGKAMVVIGWVSLGCAMAVTMLSTQPKLFAGDQFGGLENITSRCMLFSHNYPIVLRVASIGEATLLQTLTHRH